MQRLLRVCALLGMLGLASGQPFLTLNPAAGAVYSSYSDQNALVRYPVDFHNPGNNQLNIVTIAAENNVLAPWLKFHLEFGGAVLAFNGLSVSPFSQDHYTLVLRFNSSSLPTGTYVQNIVFESNAANVATPPFYKYPVTLRVLGGFANSLATGPGTAGYITMNEGALLHPTLRQRSLPRVGTSTAVVLSTQFLRFRFPNALAVGGSLTVTPSLTFPNSSRTYKTARSFSLLADDDNVVQGDRWAVVRYQSLSEDSAYQGVFVNSTVVLIKEDDVAGFSLSSLNVTAFEGGASGTILVTLSSRPVFPVNITFALPSTAQVSQQLRLSPTTLYFDAATWNVPVQLVFQAIDDPVVEGRMQMNISLSGRSMSDDGHYSGLAFPSVLVTIEDNDLNYLSIYPNYGYTSTATTDPRLITNVTVSYPLTSTLSPNSFGSVVPPVVECGFLTDRGDYRNSSGQVLGARQVRCQVPPCALDQFGRNCQTPVTLLLIVNGQPTTSNSKFYYIPAAPQVRSVSPAEGDLRSDTTITVTGLGISTTPYTTCRIDNRLVVGTVLANGGENGQNALVCVAPPRPDFEGGSKQVIVEISLNGAQETFDRVKFVYKDRISDRNELVWKVFLAVANVLLLIAILVVLGDFCWNKYKTDLMDVKQVSEDKIVGPKNLLFALNEKARLRKEQDALDGEGKSERSKSKSTAAKLEKEEARAKRRAERAERKAQQDRQYEEVMAKEKAAGSNKLIDTEAGIQDGDVWTKRLEVAKTKKKSSKKGKKSRRSGESKRDSGSAAAGASGGEEKQDQFLQVTAKPGDPVAKKNRIAPLGGGLVTSLFSGADESGQGAAAEAPSPGSSAHRNQDASMHARNRDRDRAAVAVAMGPGARGLMQGGGAGTGADAGAGLGLDGAPSAAAAADTGAAADPAPRKKSSKGKSKSSSSGKRHGSKKSSSAPATADGGGASATGDDKPKRKHHSSSKGKSKHKSGSSGHRKKSSGKGTSGQPAEAGGSAVAASGGDPSPAAADSGAPSAGGGDGLAVPIS